MLERDDLRMTVVRNEFRKLVGRQRAPQRIRAGFQLRLHIVCDLREHVIPVVTRAEISANLKQISLEQFHT